MNNEKWTKGEWVVSQHGDEVAVYMGEAVNSPYEYNCSDVWNCDSYWYEEDEVAIANAHLIAAAPDLYAELSDLAYQFTCQCGHPSCSIERTRRDIEKVLAKARGEQ